ncbi:MAG: alpha/beta fold hydrolase, partial [Anaerolineales bacterium]
MNIDLDLYRHEVRVSTDPLVRLSAIDISPDRPQRTIVFLHGFGGYAGQWVYQLQKFSLANRVIALDLRGHGLSDKPSSGYDMATSQADLEKAFEILKVNKPFVLVGHSFGGALVTEFALNHPEQIEGLVLMATAGEFKLNALFRFGLNLPLPLLRLIDPFTRSWLAAPPRALKPFYHDNLSKWVGWEKFSALQVPSLVVRGHRDLVFERPMFEKVTESIPGAEEADIRTSGHLVMLERREAVNRALERFLEGESQRSWRDEKPASVKSNREALEQERPWLSHYEKGVPYTIGIPNIPVHHLLRSAVRRFPRNTAVIFEGGSLSYR